MEPGVERAVWAGPVVEATSQGDGLDGARRLEEAQQLRQRRLCRPIGCGAEQAQQRDSRLESMAPKAPDAAVKDGLNRRRRRRGRCELERTCMRSQAGEECERRSETWYRLG